MACCGSDSGGDDKLVIDVEPDATTIDSPNASEFSKKLSNLFTPAWGLYAFAVVIVLIIIFMVFFSKHSMSNQLGPEYRENELSYAQFVEKWKAKHIGKPQDLSNVYSDVKMAMSLALGVYHKPLIVYIHDSTNSSTEKFCRALLDEKVSTTIDDSFLFWSGDAATLNEDSKQFAIRYDLQDTVNFPFIGMFQNERVGFPTRYDNSPYLRSQLAVRLDGDSLHGVLVQVLSMMDGYNQELPRNQPYQDNSQDSKYVIPNYNANVPSSTYDQDHHLMEEQNAEYDKALKESQNELSTEDDTQPDSSQTEQPPTESADQSDSNIDAKLNELRAAIPAEPAQGQKDGVVLIRVRLSNEEIVERPFLKKEPLKGLLAWVEFVEMTIKNGPIGEFTLHSRYPHKGYSKSESEEKLQTIFPHGDVRLFVKIL
eukprot:221782_1